MRARNVCGSLPGRTPPSLADDEGNTTQLLALAFAGIMLLPFSIGGVFGAYLAGGFVAGSETEPSSNGPGGVRLRVDIRGRIRWIPRVRRGAPSRQPRRPVDGGFTPGPDQWPPPHRTPRSGPRSSSQSAAPLGRVRRRCRLTSRSPPCCSHLCLSCDRDPSRLHHRTRGAKRRRSIAAAQPPRTLFLVLLGIGCWR